MARKPAPVRVEMLATESLIPYARNARTHPAAQVAQIAASIREFGFTAPVLVDGDAGIIAGHGRVLAARLLGMERVPCIRLSHLTPTQRKAYILADNRLAERAGWDAELVRLELEDLKAADFNLEPFGFGFEDLTGPKPGKTDPDAVPAERATSIKPGDLFELGEHRLLCGDSTKAEDVARVMGGARAALMNTDPPYGVDYGDIANSRDRAADKKRGGDGKLKRDSAIVNDDLTGEGLQRFLESAIKAALPHLIENPAFYLWHPMLTQGTFFAAAAAAAADILIHRQIIWVKPSLILGRGDYHWRHELCFYGWIRGKRCQWLAGRDQTTIWELSRDPASGGSDRHPTQKPVELFLRPIRNHCKPGDVIYEPFSGSGSQIIAAEQERVAAHAIEQEPRYVQVAIDRWEAFTDKKAEKLA